MYDVSSVRGLKSIDQTLAIGIARQQGLTQVRPRVWMAHSSECRLDPEETIEIVRATARRLPDAAAQARDEALAGDENKSRTGMGGSELSEQKIEPERAPEPARVEHHLGL